MASALHMRDTLDEAARGLEVNAAPLGGASMDPSPTQAEGFGAHANSRADVQFAQRSPVACAEEVVDSVALPRASRWPIG
jgi:hypothetical protein